MAWAATSQSKIIIALLYPFNRDGLLWVGTAMAAIDKLPSPINQQAIDQIELLLIALDAIDLKISTASANAGLTRANNVEFDPQWAYGGLQRQRIWLRAQISAVLGLPEYVNPLFGNTGNTLSRS